MCAHAPQSAKKQKQGAYNCSVLLNKMTLINELQLNSVLLHRIILQTETQLTWHIFGFFSLDRSSSSE